MLLHSLLLIHRVFNLCSLLRKSSIGLVVLLTCHTLLLSVSSFFGSSFATFRSRIISFLCRISELWLTSVVRLIIINVYVYVVSVLPWI